MRVQCLSCNKGITFDGEQPRFCSYCGQALGESAPVLTAVEAGTKNDTPAFHPDAVTFVPKAGSSDCYSKLPDQVGGYRLLNRLGVGGMGSVYEAEDLATGQKVAIKLVKPGTELFDCRAVQRFRQEGKLASTLTHPRCVFVLTADEDRGQPYIVMELMPGRTLTDLVKEKGPLPYREAVSLILDVVEGLKEAHRLGLVHRDVKPSNCFLDTDGRVKIGDFGLAKSLDPQHASEAPTALQLTGTGAFIGTPLFAAPEQIKGENIDQQADIYAVAATLYYLLTGHAPFEELKCNSTALLARIVCEDPEPISTFRKDVPTSLERVLQRALDRDKKRRYRDLESLRQALIIYQPKRQGIVRFGLRIMAFVVDFVSMFLFAGVIGVLLGMLTAAYPNNQFIQLLDRTTPDSLAWDVVSSILIFSLVIVLPELLFGCTLGKWCCRLRLYDPQKSEVPSMRQILLRGAIFLLVVETFNWGTTALGMDSMFDRAGQTEREETSSAEREWSFAFSGGKGALSWMLGLIALASTMRSRNGYRGLHEILSGTSTIVLHRPAPQPKIDLSHLAQLTPTFAKHLDTPLSLGGYALTKLIWQDNEQKLYSGNDPRLGRTVWIWIRPVSAGKLSETRRRLSRPERWRWLAGGENQGQRWEAFLATTGVQLTEVIRHQPLDWTATFHLIRDLTDELNSAHQDQTMPVEVSLRQIWLQPRGRTQLLDVPTPEHAHECLPNSEQESLRFVGLAAASALEGKSRHDCDHRPLQVAIPVKAYELVNRLLGYGKPVENLAKLQSELTQLEERPFRMTRWWRLRSIFMQGVLYMVAAMIILSLLLPLEGILRRAAPELIYPYGMQAIYYAAILVVVLAWTSVFKGRSSLGLVGLAIRRKDGAVLEWWRSAWRSLILGLLLGAMLGIAELVRWQVHGPELPERFVFLSVYLGLILVQVGLVLWHPTRAWHDRLAGTVIVPR